MTATCISSTSSPGPSPIQRSLGVGLSILLRGRHMGSTSLLGVRSIYASSMPSLGPSSAPGRLQIGRRGRSPTKQDRVMACIALEQVVSVLLPMRHVSSTLQLDASMDAYASSMKNRWLPSTLLTFNMESVALLMHLMAITSPLGAVETCSSSRPVLVTSSTPSTSMRDLSIALLMHLVAFISQLGRLSCPLSIPRLVPSCTKPMTLMLGPLPILHVGSSWQLGAGKV
mmetsp:Transcript_29976/g.58838  ORF Transcript_29976/g.58838 Transcript_29976/m.58838 type:complete len:228 (+) Transcript_29976:219-902(+)